MADLRTKDDELNNLTNTALGLLARREYSKGELRERLSKRSSNTSLIDQVLEALSEQGLQSDERFSEGFVRYRINQGKGPLKIRQDLRLKRVSTEDIDRFLDQDDDFWVAHASDVYNRKFSDIPIQNEKDMAKRLRFLVSRGFSAQMVFSILERHKYCLSDM